MFRCGKAEYRFCKTIRVLQKIWDEISKRPKFLPLPKPMNIETWEDNKNSMKYKSFNELKYKETNKRYRPSFVKKPKSDSYSLKGKKL